MVVACYCPEPLSQAAEKAVAGSRSPAISALTEVEFCSALSIKTRTGTLDVGSAGRIMSLFRSHLRDNRYRILAVGAREFALACEWIGRFSVPLRSVDALHLAVAFANNLTLVTADRTLAQSARHFGVKHKVIP